MDIARRQKKIEKLPRHGEEWRVQDYWAREQVSQVLVNFSVGARSLDLEIF